MIVTREMKMPDGKYRGDPVTDILIKDPSYFLKIHRKITFSEDLLEEAYENITEEAVKKNAYPDFTDYLNS